jgi:hypothetical protein
MENIFKDIVHKLWKVHYVWLRENLAELHVQFFNKVFCTFRFFKTIENNKHFFKSTNFFLRFEQFLARYCYSSVLRNLRGRGCRFLMTLESRISRFKLLFSKLLLLSFQAGGLILVFYYLFNLL